jgi:hypothetical protein
MLKRKISDQNIKKPKKPKKPKKTKKASNDSKTGSHCENVKITNIPHGIISNDCEGVSDPIRFDKIPKNKGICYNTHCWNYDSLIESMKEKYKTAGILEDPLTRIVIGIDDFNKIVRPIDATESLVLPSRSRRNIQPQDNVEVLDADLPLIAREYYQQLREEEMQGRRQQFVNIPRRQILNSDEIDDLSDMPTRGQLMRRRRHRGHIGRGYKKTKKTKKNKKTKKRKQSGSGNECEESCVKQCEEKKYKEQLQKTITNKQNIQNLNIKEKKGNRELTDYFRKRNKMKTTAKKDIINL